METANYATVGGGNENLAQGDWATVSGGFRNAAQGASSTVSGGEVNTARAPVSSVGGGQNNRAWGSFATVSGGTENFAEGDYATVAGGEDNWAAGDYSFAAGHSARAGKGSFAWADSTNEAFGPLGDNTFGVRASGGVSLFTNSDLSSGAMLPSGGSSWGVVSSRNSKENLEPVEGAIVLARLAAIPFTTWNYKSQDKTIRHMGPVAQDFHAAFGLGSDDRRIQTVDADGVALAAIQGLYQRLREKEEEIEALRQGLEELRVQLNQK